MDEERVKNLIKNLIIEIGEDPTREGLRDTPKRIAKMYKEIHLGNHCRLVPFMVL